MSLPTTQPAVPRSIHLLAAVALAFLIVPMLALASRVPWGELTTVLAAPATWQMLGVTVASASLATVLTVLVGVPLALSLQVLPKGAGIARALVLLPLAMPPVVAGLALTAAFGRKGLLAPLLDATGIQVAFSFTAVVLAHSFVALPFVVVSVDAAMRQFDREVWYSAQSVGLSPWATLLKVVLPGVRSAIFAGAGLAFARSLGEFGTTITFAGSAPGVTRTLPVGIYLARETDPASAYTLAVLLMVIAMAVLGTSALPLLRRASPEVARTLSPIDAERIAALCTPRTSAPAIEVAGITIPASTTTAVIGPNGAGKTTLLRRIAGRIHAPVRIDGREAQREPMWQRGVVMLTQQPGLPTHCTVLQTIAMVAADKAEQLLEAAGLAALRDVPVRQLSGGQAAQVALLRALAARPAVLLLDEPLAAIDVQQAQRWRTLLTAACRGRTVVLVSHDPADVATLASHVIVLHEAQPCAPVSTKQAFERPDDAFMAEFAGLNRLPGRVAAENHGSVELDAKGQEVFGQSRAALAPGANAVAIFSPADVTVKLPTEHPDVESARNHWHGRISGLETHKNIVFVRVKLAAASITLHTTQASALRLQLAVGTNVICAVKALNVHIHPDPERDHETTPPTSCH